MIINRHMYDVVLRFCEGLDEQSIIPDQLPLLLEFLCSYVNNEYLEELKIPINQNEPIPPFIEDVPDISEGLRAAIDSVYILTYSFYFMSLPPLPFLRQAVLIAGREWDPQSYQDVVRTFRRCSRKLDLQLLGVLEQKTAKHQIAKLDYDVSTLTLNEEDKARYYALATFTDREVRLRLALIQFFNFQLRRVVHLVEVGASKNTHSNTLGMYLSLLTGYIFPSVKENFLELSILQTTYHGKDRYPIVELDNRRVYTDMERSELQMRGGVDLEGNSALSSQCTFAQLFRQMREYKVEVMRAPLDPRERLLSVKYKGEQGLDFGGLYRDTIERWYDDDDGCTNNDDYDNDDC